MTKASEATKRWRATHKDHARKLSREYYYRHKARILAQRNVDLVSPTLEQRFRERIQPQGECLVWTGFTTSAGYGLMSIATGISRGPHHVAWYLAHGVWPKMLRHSCDNPLCCNVQHLQTGTQCENMGDKVARNRQARGEQHGMHKLTSEQVAEMRQLREEGWTLARLAERFNVCQSNVSQVCNRRTRVAG